MGLIYTYDKKVREWIKDHIVQIIVSVVGGMAVYFMLMAFELVNSLDGIWHTSNFVAGNWEISLGRGLLRYWDKLRFGVVSVPFNTLLTLALLAVGTALILDLFRIKNKFMIGLVNGVIIVNATVCCTLTYSYHAVNYGIAFLLSVVAACFIYYIGEKNLLLGILAGGATIAVTMATYQPYMSVTCILLLMLVMDMVLKCVDSKRIIRHIIVSLCSIPIGGLCYWVFTQLMLRRAGMELAGYGGAGSVSVGKIITGLPSSLVNCYKLYYDFFVTYKMDMPLSLTNALMLLMGLFLIACVIYQAIRLFKYHVGYGIVFLVAVLLMPVAGTFVTIIAVGSGLSQLMTMGVIVNIALLCVLLPQEKTVEYFAKRGYCLIMLMLLWFGLITVTNDQLALKEGKTATVALAENIVHTLSEQGYLEENLPIALVGRPAENPLFYRSSTFDGANDYARFGCWSISAGNHTRTWYGVLYNYCGTALNICGEMQYEAIRQNELVGQMPEFPLEGSIREIDGVVVVKVSEVY